MEFTITKEQIERLIKMAEHGSTNVIKADLKNWFPEAFKRKLAVGRWYKGCSDFTSLIYITEIEEKSRWNNIFYYGFVHGEFKSSYIANNSHENSLVEATDKEVEDALKAEAKKRGFGNARIKFMDLETGEKAETYGSFMYLSEEGTLKHLQTTFFKDGIWATILPEEKTVITKEKALKILAKKLKVSPENIEIQ